MFFVNFYHVKEYGTLTTRSHDGTFYNKNQIEYQHL